MTNPTKTTTIGSLLIRSSLPNQASKDGYDIHAILDKGGMANLVNGLIKNGGPEAHNTINNLGKTFFNKATEIGASTPLTDYMNTSDERDAIIKEYDFKVGQIKDKNLNKWDLNKELAVLTSQYNTKIEDQNLSYLLSRGSTAAKMAKTGARGNKMQLASGTSTPLMSLNMSGTLVPLVIKHSFAQGMTPAEHLALSYMGRGNTVLAQLSTSKPGALFKRLAPAVFNDVITTDDCHTSNGIMKQVSDKKAVFGRFEAGTNKFIDESYYDELKADGKKLVKVRSALTCEANAGLCKKCFGMMANGKMPNIGENVGVIAAQSVSEVLTQAMLSTKHKASVGERQGNAYDQAANILNNPTENFKDEATISTLNGKVNKVEKTVLGDHNVYIEGVKHFVPINQSLSVVVGDDVLQGDKLSTGVINPRKLVALRGIGAGREYLSNELRDIYGGGLDPRHFEVIARNLIKYVQVIDAGESGFLPGDKLDINVIAKYLQHTSGVINTKDGAGKVLSKGVLTLVPGTLLDSNHVQELLNNHIDKIEVSPTKLRISPIVPGLQTSKLLDKNWISKLSFAKLKDTLTQAAALHETSTIHSTDPITPYIMGGEFGEGEEGKY